MDRMFLIDGLNFIHRADIKFGKKEDQTFLIVYNFFRNLRAIIEEFQPTKVFFCLEGKNNFRYNIFKEYKSNRIIKKSSPAKKKSTENFDRQADIIINLLSNLPITIVKADGFECDDIIATLVEDLKDEEVIVVSNDSDFIQLMQKGYKKFKIYNPFKKEYMAAPEYHYLTWKCIAGDTSDNIPGLVGPKVADELAKDTDKFIEFLSSDENRSNYSLNKELIELKIVPYDSLQIIDYNVDYDLIKDHFLKMEFKSMLEDKYWNRFFETFSSLR